MQLLGQEPVRRGRATGGWQDSCAVHDLRASDGESAPWRQDARAVHSPTALCGAFRMHGAHILPKLAESECMQAICCHEPAFSRPRPLRERIGAQSCHGRQHGNASGRYLAMARRRMIATEVHRRPISDCNGQVMLNSHSSALSIFIILKIILDLAWWRGYINQALRGISSAGRAHGWQP